MICSSVIDKKNENCKEIQTNHLIVLCEIKEDYKSFCDDLEELIKSKSNRDLVSKVYHAMQGKLFIGSKKYKWFIEKHKHTIRIMNRYSCLSNFTVLSYDEKGKRRENLTEDYFYQFIQEHKEDIETIKAVALKLKNLGFDEITFGEELDFTKIEYKLYSTYESYFAFLENMEVSSTYSNIPIKYRTNDSCYCMILGTSGYGDNKEVSKYDRKIELNSLIFDSNRLPNEVTTESTIEVIYELAQKKEVEQEDLRHSIDLSISTSDLKDYFERLKAVTERIDKIKDNQELIKLLNQIQNALTQLQLFGDNFETQIIDSHNDITEETIKREKELYLDRRYMDSIDID